jgi:enoyl-CoA hydratase
MQTYHTINVQRTGAVARLTLDRSHCLNAINKQMLNEIQSALDAIEGDTSIHVLVVSGAGQNFSSGFDLKEQMEARPEGTEIWREILTRDFDTVMRFWHFAKPTIAAVRGYCLAGAFELALACDVTIAADDAIFGEPELKFGAGIVVMLLPWLVGPKRAKEIILTGADRIPAQEALQIGLVNRVVRADDLDNTAFDVARRMATIEPNLVQQTKRAINRTFETMGLLEALRDAVDIDLVIEGAGSNDKRRFMEIARSKGLRAAIAWRDARFEKASDD